MRLPSIAALALSAVLPLSAVVPLSAMAATVIVQPGETLSDIASRYNVSIGVLMRLNGINNPDHVEIGSRLKIPNQGGTAVKAGSGRHQVTTGETLSAIAVTYQISPRELMAVNGLRDANHVEVGQVLKLPSNAVIVQAKPKPVPVKAVPGALEHTVGKGQTLTQIAKAYKIPLATLISINDLSDPNKVKIGTTLYVKPSAAPRDTATASNSTSTPFNQPTARPTPSTAKPSTAKPSTAVKPQPKPKQKPTSTTSVIAKTADWRTYGPLQIDWANWQAMDGSHVAPTLNAQGQALYLAVNCSAGKLNATGADGNWRTWSPPRSVFEKELMKDRCQAKA